jgi:SAM-dependent methyltransferase
MAADIGTYEAKQLLSSSRIVRWSHGRRFELARGMVRSLGGRSLLDYGCGDGTFLKKVRDLVDRCVACDVVPCDLSHLDGVTFVAIRDLDETHTGRYDLVFCMEVLEHCVAADVEKALDDLQRLVAPDGTIVISVPIEIGPTLLGKQTVRRILGARKLGDYEWTERYSLQAMIQMLFADERTAIDRPTYGEGQRTWHSHFGFNWRALKSKVESRFVLMEERFSPLAWTRGFASSQVWFICRPK